LVHNEIHYVPIGDGWREVCISSEHLRNQQRRIKYIVWVSGT
jgi:hypothetical protein